MAELDRAIVRPGEDEELSATRQVLANAERVLAIELLAGVQGVEFLAPLQPGAGVRTAREFVRSLSPRLRDDRQLSGDIEAVAEAVRDGSLVEAVEAEVGELR